MPEFVDNPHQREVEIYEAALKLVEAEARRCYLDQACGPDALLRQRVERLLALRDSAEAFFKTALGGGDGETAQSTQGVSNDGSPQEGPGSLIGRYKLLEQIGKGGFGMVYMAEQTEPIRRRVALKIIKLGMDTQEVIARFEAERQALALIDHPHVARVLDAGATETGRPYFVMELVPGCPITDYCDENRLTARERLELFIPVCAAVQHAHQKGIIHRDLKPSNILVTLLDGRPMPKIIDFGIAKAIEQPLTARTLFTRFGRMIGTPAYMSPEQSELGGLDIDTRSDIYSLGVVLYELLTGTSPLEPERLHRAALAEMQRIIQEEEPPRPSVRIDTLGDESKTVAERRRTDPQKLGRLLCGDLDWIVMKTLEKDRQRRYPSASALAEDIERHLRDEPVSAGPPRLSYRLHKFVRRHRRTAVSISLVVLFLLLGFLLATVAFVKARQERNRAVAAEEHSEKERRLGQQEAQHAREREAGERMVAYASDMGLAKSSVDSGNLGRTLMLLINAVAFAADGSQVAGIEGSGHLWIWEVASRRVITHYQATSFAEIHNSGLAFADPPAQIWVGGYKGEISLTEALSGKSLLGWRPHTGMVTALALSPGHLRLATGSGFLESSIKVWDPVKMSCEAELEGHRAWISALAYSPDGAWLASASADQTIRLWDARRNKLAYTLRGHLHEVWTLAFSAIEVSNDGTLLASGGTQLRIWKLTNGTLLHECQAHKQPTDCLAFSPDGRLIATASQEGSAKLWEMGTWRELAELRGHLLGIHCLAFSPNSQRLATGSMDQEAVKLWDLRTRREVFNLSLRMAYIRSVEFSPNGNTLCAFGEDYQTVQNYLWSVPSMEEINAREKSAARVE